MLLCSEPPEWRLLFFFFFQAEDGIRDLTVTGVQTCALPICHKGEWNATSIDFTNPAFAFVAAVKKAQSLDPKKIGEAMRTVEFDNLWGKAHFGGKDYYGVGNQIIYPMPFSEVKEGVATLVVQLSPPHN